MKILIILLISLIMIYIIIYSLIKPYYISRQKPYQEPTQKPYQEPTQKPYQEPTQKPYQEPTQKPYQEPTQKPSQEPTQTPSQEPTQTPSQEPTQTPSQEPTQTPSQEPTQKPYQEPTQTLSPVCKLSLFSKFSNCKPVSAMEEACSTVLEKGLTCPGPNIEGSQYCVRRECDVNCQLSDWIKGPCDPITKKQILKRNKIVTEKRNGTCKELDYYGNVIESPLLKEESCNPECLFGEWSNWSECKADYTNKTSSRYRTRTNSCKHDLDYEYDRYCPVDCLMSNWEIESLCNKKTGTKNNKYRKIIKPSLNGGNCPIDGGEGAVQYILGEECPIDCVWGDWEWQSTSGSGCNCKDNFIRKKIVVEKNGGTCSTLGYNSTESGSWWSPINKTFNFNVNGNTFNTCQGCCNRYDLKKDNFGNQKCYAF
jgi:hypothetical protein